MTDFDLTDDTDDSTDDLPTITFTTESGDEYTVVDCGRIDGPPDTAVQTGHNYLTGSLDDT